MGDTVIQVENLWKEYRLGSISHRTLSRDLQSWWARLRSMEDPNSQLDFSSTSLPIQPSPCINKDRFWALQDISFEVKQGDLVGIVGRNGAGKSTLLKILSQVTAPTKGEVRFKGRIASLLEVGTGFHPELTGKENIFLNGAILGMSKADIRNKLDEIVAFAEIEKFVDTPVKRYSSGMYVRLAFAIAAHLEPEMLIVDEVLAVGDVQFQKKCLGKMKDVGKEGRTVLFVSHNMQAIRQLCTRALLLNGGTLLAEGTSEEIVKMYLANTRQNSSKIRNRNLIGALPSDDAIKFKDIVLRQNGKECDFLVESGNPLEIEIVYRVTKKSVGLRVYVDLYDDSDSLLFRSFHDSDQDEISTFEEGEYISTAVFPGEFLAPLNYELRIMATIFLERHCIPVDGIIIPLDVEKTGRLDRAYIAPVRGKLAPMIPWKTKRL